MKSFYTSTNSLHLETSRLYQYIEQKFYNLVFYPFMLELDIDHKSFCSHYNSLLDYSKRLKVDSDNIPITDRFEELPELTLQDFEFSTFGIPFYLLCVLFPLNAIVWTRNYIKLTTLRQKLSDAQRQLGTIEFMLKATVS